MDKNDEKGLSLEELKKLPLAQLLREAEMPLSPDVLKSVLETEAELHPERRSL